MDRTKSDPIFRLLSSGAKFAPEKARKRRKEPLLQKRMPLHSQEDAGQFRRQNRIKVYNHDSSMPLGSFSALKPLSRALYNNIKGRGYQGPSAVQAQAMPILLEGADAFVVAPTGSGKTLAYLGAVVCRLARDPLMRALVVTPTKELARQVHGEAQTLCRSTGIEPSVVAGAAPAAGILISSPLALVKAIRRGHVRLDDISILVLDEADKLLEASLVQQLDAILAACTHPSLQKVLLSATIPTGVEQLAATFMVDPVRIVVGPANAAARAIEQQLLFVGQEEGKLLAMQQLLSLGGLEPPVIVFCETVEGAERLCTEMRTQGVSVDVMHGRRTLEERARIVDAFRKGSIWFLITTELLARGLDFPDVTAVINYDFPTSTASYVHRIGRTGRAGRWGKAITLYTRDDVDALKVVVNVMRQSGCVVPEWMVQLERKSNKSLERGRRKRMREQRRLVAKQARCGAAE